MLSMCHYCRHKPKWETLLPREIHDLVGEGYLLHCEWHTYIVRTVPHFSSPTPEGADALGKLYARATAGQLLGWLTITSAPRK